MNPQQFQPLKVSHKVKQAALRPNLTLLQRNYTYALCQKLIWFIRPEVLRVLVIT